jgi:uncharacterized membrane protein YdbT with pleckstrin-like domain
MAFALEIAGLLIYLLWALCLKVKIFYSNDKVNKLTFAPFNAIIWCMTFFILQAVFELLLLARKPCVDAGCASKQIQTVLEGIAGACLFAAWIFYVTFVMYLFQQNRIMWHFIYYQAKTDFNQLDIKKGEY